MGRATLALFRGNVIQSLAYNILCIPFTIAIIISLCWASFDIINHKETFLKVVTQNVSVKYKFLVFGLILIDWTINVVRL